MGKAAQGSNSSSCSIVRRMSSTSSMERSSVRGSGRIGIIRVERLDATSSTRRRRRIWICCDWRTAAGNHVAAVVLHADGQLFAERRRDDR